MAGCTVLLVDDEASVTAGLARHLRRQGWHMHEAASAEQALLILDKLAIDVVVTDQEMPGKNGLSLLRTVAERWPACIRIMLTGHASLDLVLEAINEGHVDQFFVKPCSPAALAHGIRREQKFRSALRAVRGLVAKNRRQQDLIQDMAQAYPDITEVSRDADGAIVLDEDEAELADFLAELEQGP